MINSYFVKARVSGTPMGEIHTFVFDIDVLEKNAGEIYEEILSYCIVRLKDKYLVSRNNIDLDIVLLKSK